MKEAILKLLKDRYFLSNEKEWKDIVDRVSVIYPDIREHILNFEFIPSSPTLFNLNTNGERKGTLSSCFIIDIEDSMEGIMDTARDIALITKASGGVGTDVSPLRSSYENVKSIGNRKSSGPLPFVDIFNSILDGVQQGGARRGAGMCMLNVDHGNILDFIKAKDLPKKFERFNFSVRLNNKFYDTLENSPNSIWYIREVVSKKEIPLLDENGQEVSVKQLWDLIIDKAWSSAEPGLFNADIAFRRCTVINITPKVAANPCQEFVNIPDVSCNLGSMNLFKFVENKKFNWIKFETVIRKATRYLDSVIDNNVFPLKKIKDTTLKIRPIGLGYMGLAHALYEMEIPYNSKEGQDFLGCVNRFLTLISMDESCVLAKEKSAYEAFNYDLFMYANDRFFTESKYDVDTINKAKLAKDIKKYGVRNSCFTSIAPTGSISYIADTSSGIEPVFALTFTRKIEKLNKQYDHVFITDPIFEKYLDNNHAELTKINILEYVAANNGSCQGCDLIPKKWQKVFVVAGDLTPMEHLESLAIAANETSLSVSKTINLPKTATREEISQVYIEAYKKGIIGVTVYRDGCREGILVHGNNTKSDRPETLVHHHAPKRSKDLLSEIYHTSYKGENWIAFIGFFENKPYEIFCGKNNEEIELSNIKNGIIRKIGSGHYSFLNEQGETIIENINKTFHNDDNDDFARAVSLALRSGIHLNYIVDTLNKSKGDITKFSKVLSRILKKHIKDGEESTLKCETCGSKLIYFDGCIKCSNPECGFSKCG